MSKLPSAIPILLFADLPIREIAKELGVPKSTVARWLKAIKEQSNVVVPFVPRLVPLVPNPPSPPLDVERKNVVELVPTPEPLPTERTPPPARLPQFASIHRFWLSVAYRGIQPEIGEPITNKSHTFYRSSNQDYTLDAHPGRLLVWIHGVKGEDSTDIKGKARGKARAALAEIARQNMLSIDWGTFREVPVPEYVLESGPLNSALMEVLEPKRAESEAKLGLLPGDRSDPHNIETKGKLGEVSLDGLYYVTHVLPKEMAAMRETMKLLEKLGQAVDEHQLVLNGVLEAEKGLLDGQKAILKILKPKGVHEQ
jgi:hypothetical protein